jgi:hypothetical protein
MVDSLIRCSTAPGHGSDHFTILTSFDLEIVHRDPPLRRNFCGADWKEFQPLLNA